MAILHTQPASDEGRRELEASLASLRPRSSLSWDRLTEWLLRRSLRAVCGPVIAPSRRYDPCLLQELGLLQELDLPLISG